MVAEKSAGKVENRRLNLSVKNVEIVGRMSVIQENVRTCDLLCAKALLSGFHTFRASMCWLALVAEMLLLEVGHSKERRVSVDVAAGREERDLGGTYCTVSSSSVCLLQVQVL